MNKRIIALATIMALTLSMFLPIAMAAIPDPPGRSHYVIGTIGEPETVDPALAYDTASGELIMQVYETVVEFKGSTLGEFVPELATAWTVSPDGQTYTFTIRDNVQFHDTSILTAADVEYSWERVLVRDYAGGPGWMFFEPIFGTFNAAQMGDLTTVPGATAVGQAIDAAIESSGNTVTIQFATGRAYPPFMAILAQTWASVLSKAWCTAQGDWPGTGLQDGTWVSYRRPSQSPLDGPPNVMMGTGPFRFDYWTHAAEWSIVKFDSYWGTWGNPRRGFAARGYFSRVTEKQVADWPTRLTGFLAGIYDSIYVPRSYITQVWQQPGVQCIYPLTAISVDAMFFNYNATTLSPYIGDGAGYGPTVHSTETGVNPDFFSDVNVRKGMAYSFDWSTYIGAAFMGEAKQNAIPVPDSFPYFNGSKPKYGVDLTKATAAWQAAWGGQTWANGFYFTIAYNEGNLARQTAGLMMEAALEALNPKFHVDVVSVTWPTYLDQLWYEAADYKAILATYNIGWLADFPDVHNFVTPFMASWGDFSAPSSIYLDPQSAAIDALIVAGIQETDPTAREAIYNDLYDLYISQIPSVPLVQGIGRRWSREWVKGWYYNAIFPGSNFYSMWKEDVFASSGTFAGKYANWEDVNEDGKVDIKDLATAAKAFGAYYIQPNLPPNPVGPPGTFSSNWNSKVDLNVVDTITGGRSDQKVDIKDLATMAKLFGFVADPW